MIFTSARKLTIELNVNFYYYHLHIIMCVSIIEYNNRYILTSIDNIILSFYFRIWYSDIGDYIYIIKCRLILYNIIILDNSISIIHTIRYVMRICNHGEISVPLSVSVMVVCANPSTVREILLAAEELNMIDSGEYVFFNIELFSR